MYFIIRKRNIFVVAFLCLLIVVFIFEAAAIGNKNHSKYSAENNGLVFLQKHGVSVDESTLTIDEIKLPSEFNDIYENYNNLQKRAGFDISLYRGKTVKKLSYRVKGYDEVVFVNLLVFDNKIIGGDISSTALDGFMKPLFEE